MPELSEKQKVIIMAIAKHDMNLTLAAQELHYHRNTLLYHCHQMAKNYGLDPRKFYDLCRLVEYAKEDKKIEPSK